MSKIIVTGVIAFEAVRDYSCGNRAAFLPRKTVRRKMADLNVGDHCPSALDIEYARYSVWCRQLGYRPAIYDEWLKIQTPSGFRFVRSLNWKAKSVGKAAIRRTSRLKRAQQEAANRELNLPDPPHESENLAESIPAL